MIVFILANGTDPGEMPLSVAFHLGLHCLSKYLLTGIQNEKSLWQWGMGLWNWGKIAVFQLKLGENAYVVSFLKPTAIF